jgi:hypothetical protein
VARPKRFELLTPRFVVWCSIQLSYGRLIAVGATPGTERAHSYSFGRGLASWDARVPRIQLRPRPLAAPRAELDRPVRNDDAERRADRAVDEADLTAMRAHQFRRDREA